MFMIINRC